MWSDYLFTQRNKTTERAVGVGGGGERGKGVGLGQNLKKELGNIGWVLVK